MTVPRRCVARSCSSSSDCAVPRNLCTSSGSLYTRRSARPSASACATWGRTSCWTSPSKYRTDVSLRASSGWPGAWNSWDKFCICSVVRSREFANDSRDCSDGWNFCRKRGKGTAVPPYELADENRASTRSWTSLCKFCTQSFSFRSSPFESATGLLCPGSTSG